jgi:hypothetical protein
LVEFAVVLPVLVMVFLFSLWFYELVHAKLKVQEAARYAAFEATSYPLHNYREGRQALSGSFNTMRAEVMAETMTRFADLNSATRVPTRSGILASSWDPAGMTVLMTQQHEQLIYGGPNPMVNGFVVAGVEAALSLIDIISAAAYTNQNPVAQGLIGMSTGDLGGTAGGTAAQRTFGASEWGFNRSGYVWVRARLTLNNEWAQSGIMGLILPNRRATISESYGVLADSWTLHEGGNVDNNGSTTRPGVSNDRGMWQQVNRMYLGSNRGRSFVRSQVTTLQAVYGVLLGLAMASTSVDNDMLSPSVVARSYVRDENSGRITHEEDDGQRHEYDTAPVGNRGDAGDQLKRYYDTRRQRGEYFMGCREPMKLGCTDTLSSDNPFGDYIVRPENP